MKILKNLSNVLVNTNSYGKNFVIQPKGSLTITDSQEDKIATELLYRYGFLKDITPPPTIIVETKDVPEMNKKGRMVMKRKKIVKSARGVKRTL